MAVSPPTVTVVDTAKIDTLEATIDAFFSTPGWFQANFDVDTQGSVFWEGTSNTFLNQQERIILRDRYLAVGWRIVVVKDPDGTRTKTKVRVYL